MSCFRLSNCLAINKSKMKWIGLLYHTILKFIKESKQLLCKFKISKFLNCYWNHGLGLKSLGHLTIIAIF